MFQRHVGLHMYENSTDSPPAKLLIGMNLINVFILVRMTNALTLKEH